MSTARLLGRARIEHRHPHVQVVIERQQVEQGAACQHGHQGAYPDWALQVAERALGDGGKAEHLKSQARAEEGEAGERGVQIVVQVRKKRLVELAQAEGNADQAERDR